MFYWGDASFLLLIPALILAFYAQSKVSGSYRRYSQVANTIDMTGAEVARLILDRNGLENVQINAVKGTLSDNFNPRDNSLNLSEGVYGEKSVAAIAIAAHECGHALQHAYKYAPITVRGAIFPVANISSTMAFPLFIAGLIFSIGPLMDIGIILFAGALLFHVVTLPVEFNASSRALHQLQDGIIVRPDEMTAARKMLSAAALTYVAATLMALLQLVRLLILRNSRD